ncbi:ATP-dependent Clp protease ATP-binding subunit, partial [uncultured Treponema sp.]|uniref:ATP-dependent Clp protease ATP-binding subunit n=1 Tax=uncultured Treponema sp. TaxID=162155 RepID=UPI0015BA9038
MMNMKRISPRLQKSFIAAQEEGRKCGSAELFPEHVLLAILKSAEGLGYIMLQDLRVNVLTFQLKLEQAVMPRPVVSALSELPPSRRLRTVLDIAALESNSMRNDYIGTEHFLMAAFREENSTSSIFLSSAELDINAIREAARNVQYHFSSSAQTVSNSFGDALQRMVEDVRKDTVSQFSSGSGQTSQRRSQKNNSFL